jgi:UDP-glucose 4-epimerase
MRIVITGGTGFVGRYLTLSLLQEGYEVIIFSRKSNYDLEVIDCPILSVDYSDPLSLRTKLENINPTHIIHLASSRDRGNLASVPPIQISSHINSDVNLIMGAARLRNLELFIYFGTADMYTCESREKINIDSKVIPKNIYGIKKSIGKNLIENLLITEGFPSVCLVPSVIYGPGQQTDMFIPSLIEALLLNQNFKMTDGLQFRDYIFVTDIVDAVVGLINKNGSKCLGLSLPLGSGSAIKIKDLAITVASYFSEHHRSLLQFGGLPSAESENNGYKFDILKSRTLLNWDPKISLETGIKKTINHARNLINK